MVLDTRRPSGSYLKLWALIKRFKCCENIEHLAKELSVL